MCQQASGSERTAGALLAFGDQLAACAQETNVLHVETEILQGMDGRHVHHRSTAAVALDDYAKL